MEKNMANSTQKNELSKGKLTALWTLTVLPAALFLFAGWPKLTAQPPFPEKWVHFGLPLWFLYVTGAIELGGALLLLVPRTAVFGSLLLSATMVGATLTHLKVGEYSQIAVPLVLLAMVATVGYARRQPLLDLLGALGILPKTAEQPTHLKAA